MKKIVLLFATLMLTTTMNAHKYAVGPTNPITPKVEKTNARYAISGRLNGDYVEFDIWTDAYGNASGSFYNYTMNTGWGVSGKMYQNRFSFVGKKWHFNASRVRNTNQFSGKCTQGRVSYVMYLTVNRVG